MKNIMTVDVEDWYQTSDFSFPRESWNQYERRVEKNTQKILDIFDTYGVKATFFVLGCVAKEYPLLVRDIARRGHEIGSHGYWHQMLTRMTEAEIREDIRSSKHLLEDVSGQSVTSYRAPSWSISSTNYQVLEILDELGFQVDSSFQPFRTPLSGISGAPIEPFYPIINGRQLKLLEWPSTISVISGVRIPFSGGLYMRIWPKRVTHFFLRNVNRKRAAMVYLHPWEFDPKQPRIKVSPLVRFTHYYHLQTTEAKLHALLKQFEFGSLGDMVKSAEFLPVAL